MRRIVTSIKGRSRTVYVDDYEVRKNKWEKASVVVLVKLHNHSDDSVCRYLLTPCDAEYDFGDSTRRDQIDSTMHLEGYFEIDAIEPVEYKGEWYDKIHLKPANTRNRA